jgi:hypothetical protein
MFCFQWRNFETHQIVRRNLGSVFEADRPVTAAGRHVAIRFEDMHCKPERTLRALASWIGIDWEPGLLDSTIDGERYYFPGEFTHTRGGSETQGVTGFSPARARDRTFHILSPMDRVLLRLVLRKNYIAWAYEDGPPAWMRKRWVAELVLRLLTWLPMRAQRILFLRDLATAVKQRSMTAFCGVLGRYAAEVAPTRRLLLQKKAMADGLIPILNDS